MEDARARLATEYPELVAKLDAAIALAHRTGKVQTLADGFAVYSKNQPLIVRRKGLDDPAAATADGPWASFFARLYALASPAPMRWSDIGVVTAWSPSESLMAGRVIKQPPRVEIRWASPADVERATSTAPVAPPPTSGEDEAAREADAAREALYEKRRAERAAEQARRDAASDIGGVEIASMGKSVSLPATADVLRGLKRLPATVRRLALKGGDLQGPGVALALRSLALDAVDLSGNALSAEDVVDLPRAKLGVQQVPEGCGLDVEAWDFRRANPEKVYPTWHRWLDRATRATVALFERHGAPDPDLAALAAPPMGEEASWEEWCDAVYAWGDAAESWSRARRDTKDATLKRAVAAIRKVADGVVYHEEEDQPYLGILHTVEALPFLVGASLASSPERPAWLVSLAEVHRLRAELRDLL